MSSELKRFVFDALLAENGLAQLSAQGISVRGPTQLPNSIAIDEVGFSPRLVHQASAMSSVFAAFYCLENAVRELITERLISRRGTDWWETAVSAKIKTAVERLREKESTNRYHTPRSSVLIGYTLFGNLAQLIIANWDDFFRSIPRSVMDQFTLQ